MGTKTERSARDLPLPPRELAILRAMRAAGIAADVVAAWHGHTERMTQAVYGRVTDDRLRPGSRPNKRNPLRRKSGARFLVWS